MVNVSRDELEGLLERALGGRFGLTPEVRTLLLERDYSELSVLLEQQGRQIKWMMWCWPLLFVGQTFALGAAVIGDGGTNHLLSGLFIAAVVVALCAISVSLHVRRLVAVERARLVLAWVEGGGTVPINTASVSGQS